MLTSAQYLTLAHHYEGAATSTGDRISRRQLDALAESYLVLAKSAAILERSASALQSIEQRGK
jgi:hypothetical protein